jgi:hypothetical protein
MIFIITYSICSVIVWHFIIPSHYLIPIDRSIYTIPEETESDLED